MIKVTASSRFYKAKNNANPCLSNVFCADPAAIEYNGRLYVYATNDQQQYEKVGTAGKNTYEFIKSLVCFSTQDMINWTFHGVIDVEKICPWSVSAWSPSVVCRKEQDGKNHFYLYFSDNGCGVGVLTSLSPLGPWTDPLGQALVCQQTEGLGNCHHPFAPGVIIDDTGTGYITFGGADSREENTGLPVDYEVMPGCSKIARLGKDLISIDSDFVTIPAPYFLEAGDLNFINGVYLYSYNNNWVERKRWDYFSPCPSACSMSYMTSKTPLVSESWKYENHYFKNPGEMGLNYSNNHTHICRFKGQWYILYHTLTLQEEMPTAGGFRSVCVDKLNITENPLKLELTPGTRGGVERSGNINPYEWVSGSAMATSADVVPFIPDSTKNDLNCEGSKSLEEGGWILIRNVEFTKVSGFVLETDIPDGAEVRIDKLSSDAVTECQSGLHNVFIVFKQKGVILKRWMAV